jgi:hypothetical protein
LIFWLLLHQGKSNGLGSSAWKNIEEVVLGHKNTLDSSLRWNDQASFTPYHYAPVGL